MRRGTVRFLKRWLGAWPLALALLVLAPALAAADGTVLVKAGADRTAADTAAGSVSPLSGAAFEIASAAAGPYTPLCTTAGPEGRCSAQVADGTWYVRPAAGPSGYRALRELDLTGATEPYRATVTVAGADVTAAPNGAPPGADRFVFARENPALPQGCPIDAALLLDRSGSMAGERAAYEAAARRLVDRLAGTPTRLRLYAVAETTSELSGGFLDLSVPADVATAQALITSAFTAPSGATNYDAALRLLAGSGVTAAVVLSDGLPPNEWAAGTQDDVQAVTASIAAANARKADGVRLLHLAAPAGAGTATLDAVAAPGDVLAGDLASLTPGADAVAERLSGTRCAARITVRKLVGGAAQPGWAFAASASGGAAATFPSGPVTAGSPPETSVLVGDVPAAGAAVTLTETPRDGLALQSAECRAGGFDGPVVSVTPAANGLVLDVARGAGYSCTFVGAPPAATVPPGLPTPLLAAPGDCLTNPGCAPGLKRAYGVDVRGVFRALDAGGAGVEALDQGLAQVAVVFTTNPEIARSDLLVLRDDKGMIGPENLVPVIRRSTLRALGTRREREARRRLAAVSRVLTTARLQDLNLSLADGRDPEAVAGEFLETYRIARGRPPARGPRIVIAHQDFDEQEIVASLYARALRAAGLRASAQRTGATGEILRRLRANRVQAFVAYTSTLLQTLEPGARPSRTAAAAALRTAVTRRLGARALEPAPGQNANAFVMKRDVASAYGVRKLSDLTRRWPVAR